ncbi:uncharacterized protein Dwil_GK14005 [Drosophila willistoni]|uniref:Uncharacterized protein n=1 Tax=Drosophila willistoni TaxID=7260 RepID=B4NKY9_DROWI|nr:uncharacterized protein LOC6650085 [Drosophila willistoni]EDW84192.1 uncharacterized protein Dwil_GK14005 [Drosophila willistoni]
MSSWLVSTTELRDCCNDIPRSNGTSTSFRDRHSRNKLFFLVWQRFAEKCHQFGNFIKRETNKPLPKELRRSLRMNKSSRRKGYRHCETDIDKRIMEERLNQPVNIAIRVGPAFDYTPSNY